MIYVLYGVSGVGKTTIGKALAKAMTLPFYDADDFHSDSNIKKMNEGIPLNDDDRRPWLSDLANQMLQWSKMGGAVLACSALKKKYRQLLDSETEANVRFICLNAELSVIADRLSQRQGHFMNPELLASQFDTLEMSPDDVCIDVNKSQKLILDEIFEKMKPQSTIGIVGLGVMGTSLALNIARKNNSLSVYNRQVANKEVDIAKNFVSKHSDLKMQGFDDVKSFVNSLSKPRNILLMVNAGKAVDMVIDDLLPYLDEGDLIMDGGNSHYNDTKRRIDFLYSQHVEYLGMGISGGEEGALKGPSMMPGGSPVGYARMAPLLDAISARDKNDQPCCAYIGPEGSGHFVKMVHNGIEYAEMQLITEVYHLLRFYHSMNTIEIAQLFEEWSHENLDSYLLTITIDILRTNENGRPILDLILDKAGQKGTGGWSTNAALSLGKPLDTISQAVMARGLSTMKKQRMEASKLYGEPVERISKLNLHHLKNAYQAGRMVNHAIGFDLIQEASSEYKWNLNLSEIARIWTNGCIIRSTSMEDLVLLFAESNEHLLLHPKVAQSLKESKEMTANVLSEAFQSGCSMSVLSASFNYFLGFISAQSSANMIQAQRDYFGAHTFQRNDKSPDESFHHNWNSEKK